MTKKLTHQEFVERAIVALRKGDYKGIHTVYSGFNAAFRTYYGEESNPVEATKALVESGKISSHFSRGGAMIYLPCDAPAPADKSIKALAAILA